MNETNANSKKPLAVVTGATRGIGQACALELARQGYDVVFTYRSQAGLAEELVGKLKALGSTKSKSYCVDFAEPSKASACAAEILKDFGGIDVLVNNAGVALDGLAMRYSEQELHTSMNTNFSSAFLFTQSFLRPMMKARSGSIIFMSSVIGQMGNAGQTVYSATKAALFGLTKSLAREVGSRGIRVNAVAPGFIETDMTSALPEQTKQGIFAQIPLGCFGSPEDVAQVVSFLASPKARYITGQVIGVNGGMYM